MSDTATTDLLAPPYAPLGDASAYWALLKPRVMRLSVFTALVGLIAAPASPHPLIGFAAILCIALGAGAAGALNMWYDADIDEAMARTSSRPLPLGSLTPRDALSFGLVLAVLSVTMMGLWVNWAAASLLALTIGFYVAVYTMWLKRRTPQNIVIGGAAGAFPPMIGWAAATGTVSLDAMILFAIIFIWTPPHFWALSLFMKADYARVGVPMLPVTAGRNHTKLQILLYSILLAPLGMAPWATGLAGPVYGVIAASLGGWFLWGAVRCYAERDDESEEAARTLFKISIFYLFLLFLALGLETAVRSAL